ncbi:unnamed protein product [Trichogramma brassicae]|uniref:Uncharacterized protein n=1 Tax=Trichogramma brassicae TaxID=86971 RepID=A0A6H5HRX4_9HYME|nr:unnamed protein product [Trichogramma brassicae]
MDSYEKLSIRKTRIPRAIATHLKLPNPKSHSKCSLINASITKYSGSKYISPSSVRRNINCILCVPRDQWPPDEQINLLYFKFFADLSF